MCDYSCITLSASTYNTTHTYDIIKPQPTHTRDNTSMKHETTHSANSFVNRVCLFCCWGRPRLMKDLALHVGIVATTAKGHFFIMGSNGFQLYFSNINWSLTRALFWARARVPGPICPSNLFSYGQNKSCSLCCWGTATSVGPTYFSKGKIKVVKMIKGLKLHFIFEK